MSNSINPRIKALFFTTLFIMVVILFILISLNIFGMAFNKLGFPPEYSVYFLFLSLPGSFMNIPITTIKSNNETNHTISIAVNLGGAFIPSMMSLILTTMVSIFEVLTATFITTILIHKIARPIKGKGIAIHALFPPIIASAVALLISPQDFPVIAYISGTLGCLIGIDILNLKNMPELGLPIVSIGGAGTFDAIFLTGIISVVMS